MRAAGRASIPVVMPPAPAETPFDLALHGSLNGALVTLDLDGVISPGELRFDVRPACPAPLVGDLKILALAAVDVPLLVATGAAQLEVDAPWCSWVDVAVRGEGGVLVGRLEIAVEAEFAGGRLKVQAQLMRGEVTLEPGERVTRVEERAVLSMAAVEGVQVATRVFAGATGRGRRLTVTSVAHEERAVADEVPAFVAELLLRRVRAHRTASASVAGPYACRVMTKTVSRGAF
jgi:hypothetical protein